MERWGVDCTCTYTFSIHVEVVRDTHCSNLRKKTQKNIFQINSLVVLPPKGNFFLKKASTWMQLLQNGPRESMIISQCKNLQQDHLKTMKSRLSDWIHIEQLKMKSISKKCALYKTRNQMFYYPIKSIKRNVKKSLLPMFSIVRRGNDHYSNLPSSLSVLFSLWIRSALIAATVFGFYSELCFLNWNI